MPIHLVYHVAIMNNWSEVVQDQLAVLESSGLGEVFDSMTVTAVGEKTDELDLIFDRFKYRNKTTIIHSSKDLRSYEFPAIEKVREIARKDSRGCKILYFHTKGVSKCDPFLRENRRLWRKYMEYFLIVKWKDCLQALDEFDACGVDLTLAKQGIIFAGNFWWGRGDYLCNCDIKYRDRFDAEAFIGLGCCPKLKTFHQSGDNPRLEMHPYKQVTKLYPDDRTGVYYKGILGLSHFPYLPEYYQNFPLISEKHFGCL